MDGPEFTQFKLMCEVAKLRSSVHRESSFAVDSQKALTALINGDPRDIEHLKTQLAHEKDRFFAVCVVALSAAIFFALSHLSAFF